MKPIVVHDVPPNYELLSQHFNIEGKKIIFAYGDKLYNPLRIVIPIQIEAHERVHCKRQGTDPAAWWARWVEDKLFRAEEEILGHRAEWLTVQALHKDRNYHARYLVDIAKRLTSDLYNLGIPLDEAMRRVRGK